MHPSPGLQLVADASEKAEPIILMHYIFLRPFVNPPREIIHTIEEALLHASKDSPTAAAPT
jgi:hypothetical protein